jgi:antiviral helicase SLH1
VAALPYSRSEAVYTIEFFVTYPIIMSPSAIDSAEAKWLSQLATMRAALADLKLPLPQANGSQESFFGEDSDFDDNLSSPISGDDVWDFISDNEADEYSSDFVDSVEVTAEPSGHGYDFEWLRRKCLSLSERKQGLTAEELQGHIMALLASDSGDEELQATLTDIIGFDDLDFAIELISHRKLLMSSASIISKTAEGDMPRLLTRREREEALRQRDYEHKHKELGPSLDRDGPKYPHVYKAHSAGNTLTLGGRKYGLPLGSERKEHEKYEEYSIPAGKVGTLEAGRRLVQISEMDGLCMRTFKGYKTLNRMQSLVYPVAYQTNENLLICAPTGAVSLLHQRLNIY